mmetsp:Transcript_34712/g.53271  ORF Transcript_34712/g.53271 Transcript_34712/m.53271 type:complete len:118 (+) Transcript_34712:580-933(+)
MTKENFEERKEQLISEPVFQSLSDSQLKDVIHTQDEISNFEISTRAEIHFTGSENIEGFASLVNHFLRAMVMSSSDPCLINVDNIDEGRKVQGQIDEGQVFYKSTLEFKDKFTALLP